MLRIFGIPLWLGPLVLILTVPAWAASSPTPEQLLDRIEQLTRELETVKQQLHDLKAEQKDQGGAVTEVEHRVEDLVKDGIGRFEVWGDYRFRMDSTRMHQPSYWEASTVASALHEMAQYEGALLTDPDFAAAFRQLPLSPDEAGDLQRRFGELLTSPEWGDLSTDEDPDKLRQTRLGMLQQALPNMSAAQRGAVIQGLLGHSTARSKDPENDTIYTNRIRLNAQVRPTENLVFKGRLAAYKLWGMDSDFASAGGGIFPSNLMAHNMTQGIRPSDSRLYVDRAYVNWTNVGGWPMWLSVGRRPTTHTPPRQLREGLDTRDATPFGANIDLPFDGATVGYQYESPAPGRIRFCYGRGFESGLKDIGRDTHLDDVDFYGLVWDVIDDPERDLLFILQAFRAEDIFDFPEGKIFLQDPAVPFGAQQVTMTTQSNLGDIYEIGALLEHKFRGIDWFASAGWSITDPKARSQGLFGGYQTDPASDPFEGVSLLTNPFDGDLETRTGWSVYLGGRIPIERLHSKFGLEYNYGSRYWMPFMIASDDLYMDKLSTRGHVTEAYWIWNLPETPLSKYARAFMRFGYQYFWFDYTGSGMWLGRPIAIDELTDDPMSAQVFAPIDRMDNFYLTFEVLF